MNAGLFALCCVCFIRLSMLQWVCTHDVGKLFSCKLPLQNFSLLGSFGCNENLFFILFLFNRNCRLSNSNFSMAAVDILYIDITRRWNSVGIEKESGNPGLYSKTMKSDFWGYFFQF